MAVNLKSAQYLQDNLRPFKSAEETHQDLNKLRKRIDEILRYVNADAQAIVENIDTIEDTADSDNPITTLGDLIRGDSDGEPERLAIGSEGRVLTVNSGVPEWVSPASAASRNFAGYEAHGSDDTLVSADIAKIHSNTEDILTDIELTLPSSPTVGDVFGFMAFSSGALLKITPGASNYLYNSALGGVQGNGFRSNQKWSYIEFAAISSSEWITVSHLGTWSTYS